MGRLIDIDKARKEYSNLIDLTMSDTTLLHTLYGVLDNASTVEAIPKADYETRLKADLKAILVELQMEIEECVDGAEGSPQFEQGVTNARVQVVELIQQKINSLKED